MKYLITGGSGFIGTNLIEALSNDPQNQILNIDLVRPKLSNHDKFWHKADLRDKNSFCQLVKNFNPDRVIHLGARTDLDGSTISDYDANIQGVTNLLEVLDVCDGVKQAVFASSMYVCQPGYMPKDFEDYAPHTLYGESKVETEKRIKAHDPKYVWSIIRPTSIWGPWFGIPYDRFFRIVLNHMYFHMGKRACRKTYGYIDNTIYQIMSIFEGKPESVRRQVYYLGDYEAYDITDWANEIAKTAGIRIPRVPYACFVMVAWIGDVLKKIGIDFPMTSFRLHNMTTDNVHDLDPIKEIAPNLPTERQKGTKRTLEWIKRYGK